MASITHPVNYPEVIKQPKTKRYSLLHLIKVILPVWKVKPNEFSNRYAEKFANPDHHQWSGGRLLSKEELQKLYKAGETAPEK